MIRLLQIVTIIGLLGICSFAQAMEVIDLKCVSKTTPVGITTAKPHVSWTFVGDNQSPEQGGYRICMATSIERLKYPDLWDTGPTSSSHCSGLEYLGEPLKSGQKIYWKVTVYAT